MRTLWMRLYLRTKSARSCSNFAILSRPFQVAHEANVWRNWSIGSILTSFRSRRILTTPIPILGSLESGVLPRESTMLGLMQFCSNSILTTSSCTFMTAQESGVWSVMLSTVLRLALLCSTSSLTTPACPSKQPR